MKGVFLCTYMKLDTTQHNTTYQTKQEIKQQEETDLRISYPEYNTNNKAP